MADNVTQLGVTKEQITRIIRQIAAVSSKVFFTDESSKQEWELVVNRLQIISCLKKGEVTSEPEKTAEGYVECEMYLFSAGQDIRVKIAVQYDDAQNRFLVVRSVSKE